MKNSKCSKRSVEIAGSQYIPERGLVMATATILQIYCVKEATGTDLGALAAPLEQALSLLPPVLTGGVDPQAAVGSVVNLVEILDQVRSDPDNLYVTTTSEGDIDNAIWPGDGNVVDIQQGQSVFPNLAVEIPAFGQNISLWDKDSFLDPDDLLASIAMFEAEQGSGVLSKLGRSQVEGSVYYVTYQVD
jgi:hypothetical protein